MIQREIPRGWWIVMHERAEDRHAVADPCPLDSLLCWRDRKDYQAEQRRLRAEEEDRL